MFLNKIEYKAKGNGRTVYSTIANNYGKTPRYSSVKYETIAKEGYSENFVFFRCLREIINAAQQGVFKVYQKRKDGKEEEILNHPILKLLENPNPLNTKARFLERAIAYRYIGGETPMQKVKSLGEVVQLLCYRPDKISCEFTGKLEQPYTNIKYLSGGYHAIDPKMFTLWKNFNPSDEFDGLGHGMSMLQPALKSGDLLNSFIDWNVSLLQNGAAPSGAWVTQEVLDPDTYKLAEKKMQNKVSGQNVGKALLLDGGASWVKIGENPKDMDWKEGKESTIVDICTAIGPDPILIGYGKYSSYNNKKEAKKDLYTSHVISLMNDLCETLTKFLELGDNEFIKMDFSHVPCMQEDEEKKWERINNNKSFTINEKRQMLGKEEIKGGDVVGDVIIIGGKVYIPMNLEEVGADKKDA